MKNRPCFIVLIIGFSLGLTLLWVLGAQSTLGAAAPHAELHVCLGCAIDNVQEAVDTANEGDIIKVAEGTYTGVSERQGHLQMVYISKTLTLQGGYATNNWVTPDPETNITILDAEGQGRVFFAEGEFPLVLAGFHITGGNANGLEPGGAGGGIFMDIHLEYNEGTPTIKDNYIYGNTAWDGGGASLRWWGGIISGNTVISNTAGGVGGGMSADGTFTDNLFVDNSAGTGGGGLAIGGDAVLRGNTFTGNSSGDVGGGILARNSSVDSDGDRIVSNTAPRGGGLAIIGEDPGGIWWESHWVNTLVADNQSSLEGAGIYISGGPLHLWHTTLANNTGGDGSGIVIAEWDPWYQSGTATVDLRNTIIANQAYALNVLDGSTVEVDSILWSMDGITLTQVPEADVSLVNQITGDALFNDPANGDYHIGAASAARDMGINAGVLTDLDGLVRPMGFGYDLGAYEYPEAALSLSKTPDLSGANVGEEITYQIVLTSSGMLDASDVILTDTLDIWQRATAVDPSEGTCTIEDSDWGGSVVCDFGNLNIGDAIEVQVTVEVDAEAPLGQELFNTLTTRADEAANDTQTLLYAQDCHVRIGDSAKEYTSLQAAVDEAYPTELVKVAGTCMGVYGPEFARQQVYLDKSLTIQGGYSTSNWTTPDPQVNITTLDARGLGRVFYIRAESGDVTLTIDGFDITGGNAGGQMGDHAPDGKYGSSGGGLYIYGGYDQFTLSNSHIFNNQANGGGGMTTSFCSGVQLIGDTFTANSALSGGGGYYLHAGKANLTDVVFESNTTGGNGGGIDVVAGNANILRGTFVNNHAGEAGGAMNMEMGWSINESLILSNTAKYGGGIGVADFINWSMVTSLTNTVIAGNQATLEGAGVFIPSGQMLRMTHVTLARNSGGDGSGITLGWYDWMSPGASSLVMTDTILAYQDVGVRALDGSEVKVNGVLWYANTENVWQSDEAVVTLLNEHTGNPLFVNPDIGDYHIGELSAARDMGIPSDVFWDLDGEQRPMGWAWDLGADEFFEIWQYLPMVVK